MSLTQDEYDVIQTEKTISTKSESPTININNPFIEQDLGVVILAFEKSCQNWAEDDYTKAYHYRDIYSTEDFSYRAREQMDYYPGMHQTASPPEVDPLYTNAKDEASNRQNFWNNAMDSPNAFMSGLESREGDFDYAKIFGTEASAKTRAENLGKILTKCVPCFNRLLDMDALLPDGDLLEVHMMNIKVRTDMIDKVTSLFKDPGLYVDVCAILKMFSHLCPQDLIAIMALLTQYLAKLNLEVNFNLDFIIQLVGPTLSPFLDALSSWLDKWIQLLLNPLVCVLDHINETILIVQQAKMPFSEIKAGGSIKTGVAGPMHRNISGEFGGGISTGFGDSNNHLIEDGFDPYAGTWSEYEIQQFNTPNKEKYNPDRPQVPREETELAWIEVADAWSPGFSDIEREERQKKWAKLRKKNQDKIQYIPPPLERENRDGTKWSKDNIPNSDKYVQEGDWEAGYYPPEEQSKAKLASEYYVTTPIVHSIVEVRNILQGGIQYVKDWFTYVTQMIYDLLGTDYGWMSKKVDTTILKSKIIQLISMIKAIFEAISNNGLECGIDGNFDPEQMKFILENGLNKKLTNGNKFEIKDDGTILMNKSPSSKITNLSNLASSGTNVEEVSVGGTPDDTITTETIEQSSVVIPDCFKSVSKEELANAKQWIADFTKKGGLNG